VFYISNAVTTNKKVDFEKIKRLRKKDKLSIEVDGSCESPSSSMDDMSITVSVEHSDPSTTSSAAAAPDNKQPKPKSSGHNRAVSRGSGGYVQVLPIISENPSEVSEPTDKVFKFSLSKRNSISSRHDIKVGEHGGMKIDEVESPTMTHATGINSPTSQVKRGSDNKKETWWLHGVIPVPEKLVIDGYLQPPPGLGGEPIRVSKHRST
jgi:hypothetical protein